VTARQFGLSHYVLNLNNGFGKALANCRFISEVHQPRGDVTGVGDVDFPQIMVAFLKLIQLPFGSGAIEIRHALARKSG
jgi:hypothetical protein